MECSNLVENDLNGDKLSYYYKRWDCSSSEFDSDYGDDVASHNMDNKVLDKVISENQHGPCNEFYDEYSNVMNNPFTNLKGPFEYLGLVWDVDIDSMCEYKSNCSFEYNPSIHKNAYF